MVGNNITLGYSKENSRFWSPNTRPGLLKTPKTMATNCAEDVSRPQNKGCYSCCSFTVLANSVCAVSSTFSLSFLDVVYLLEMISGCKPGLTLKRPWSLVQRFQLQENSSNTNSKSNSTGPNLHTWVFFCVLLCFLSGSHFSSSFIS